MSNLRNNNSIKDTLLNELNLNRQLRRNHLLNSRRIKSKYTTESVIYNIFKLYDTICDGCITTLLHFNEIDFPLSDDYINLIDDTFKYCYYKMCNGKYNMDDIINNFINGR